MKPPEPLVGSSVLPANIFFMTVDFKAIQEAVKRRDEFLKENPHLQPLQDKITEVLKNAGNDHHNRQVAIQQMMLDTWFKILDVWK